uniref:Uncharacterized protein n=1 Tax=Arundo donax TaxID=35708 RepID=A0A0A9C8P7_ARUDO
MIFNFPNIYFYYMEVFAHLMQRVGIITEIGMNMNALDFLNSLHAFQTIKDYPSKLKI